MKPARRVLATACLTFSPTFLLNVGDGEEFLWATGCFLAVLWMISRNGPGASFASWLGVMLLAAACTGYRLEVGVMAMGVAIVSLVVSRRAWMNQVALLAALAVFIGLIWAPLLLRHGASPPYDIPLPLKTRLEVGIYKILFTLLGVIPMVFAVFFYLGWWKNFRLFPSYDSGILIYWAPRLFLLFFALFFIYPTKISVVLPRLACLFYGARSRRAAGFGPGLSRVASPCNW